MRRRSHMLCAKFSPELDASETLVVEPSVTSFEEQNGRAEKKLRTKPQVMQMRACETKRTL